MLAESGNDNVVAEDASAIVMEHKLMTVEDYFGQLVHHWNNSVNSILEMGIVLDRASKDLNDKDWESLQIQLESTGIASAKQQKYLIELSKSDLIINYFQSCVASGKKPALPPDWKTLYQISTLSPTQFSVGESNNIINATTTTGDVNALKRGTHKLLPNYKAPKKPETLKGKVVAQLAVDTSLIQSEAQAKELEEKIKSAVDKVTNDFIAGRVSVSLVDTFKEQQEKRLKGNASKQEKAQKMMANLGTLLGEIKDTTGETLPMDETFAKNYNKHFGKAA